MCEICANVIFYAARSVAWPILTRNDLNGGSYGTTLIEQDRVRQQAGIAAWGFAASGCRARASCRRNCALLLRENIIGNGNGPTTQFA
jgi:hypothetical protein